MESFSVFFRYNNETCCFKTKGYRVPIVGESFFLLDRWYKKETKPMSGKYQRITAVKWRPYTTDYDAPVEARVYLHFAESYEPEIYTG